MGLFDRLLRSRSRPTEQRPACLACESTELDTLARQTYRCRTCGHEGGSGLPAYERAKAVAKILALDPDARRALAERSHAAAGNILVGIRIESLRLVFRHATADTISDVGFELAGSPPDAEKEREQAVVATVRELAEAERLLVECGHALGLGEVLQNSITTVSDDFDRPESLERCYADLRQLHAGMAGELSP